MTAEETLTLLYSPFPDAETARVAATALLEERLVACCNLLPGVESHYRWEGVLTHATEVLLLCKTTPQKATEAAERLGALHPYDTPAILQFPAVANAAYALWAASET